MLQSITSLDQFFWSAIYRYIQYLNSIYMRHTRSHKVTNVCNRSTIHTTFVKQLCPLPQLMKIGFSGLTFDLHTSAKQILLAQQEMHWSLASGPALIFTLQAYNFLTPSFSFSIRTFFMATIFFVVLSLALNTSLLTKYHWLSF